MTLVQGVFLGLMQGLTEFLPVSSSGHLVIAQHLLGLTKPPVLFDVTVHLATALAVVIIMWRRLWSLKLKDLSYLLLATIPAGVVGLWLNHKIETLFNSLPLVGVALLVTACLLFLSRRFKANKKDLNPGKALWIGLAQAMAIVPGISRSGSTITAGLWQGLSPVTAFDFSFLLSLPAIAGAETLQLIKLETVPVADLGVLAIGFASALITGLLTLKWLKKIVVNHHLGRFGWYCLAVGLLILLF